MAGRWWASADAKLRRCRLQRLISFSAAMHGNGFASSTRMMAREPADGPAFANGMTKRMLRMKWATSVDQAIEAEAVAQALCMTTSGFRRHRQRVDHADCGIWKRERADDRDRGKGDRLDTTFDMVGGWGPAEETDSPVEASGASVP